MTKVTMCDSCTDIIKQDSDYNRVVDGHGRLTFNLGKRKYDVMFQFVNPTGDRIGIDLCPVCLLKGGIGLGGKEKIDGEDGNNND